MNRRNRGYKKQNRFKHIILNHIENNIRAYFIISLIFLIGLFIGVIFINNLSAEQTNYISSYLQTFISNFKTEQNIDELMLFKDSVLKNFTLTLVLWFMGSTVIGILIVYIIILFRGFCLGCTASAILFSFGSLKGSLFLGSSILLQNIIFIPCVIALGVSGMKLYKSIMQDKRKENIKLEIIRHTMFSVFIFIVLVLSSVLEAYISTRMLEFAVRYM